MSNSLVRINHSIVNIAVINKKEIHIELKIKYVIIEIYDILITGQLIESLRLFCSHYLLQVLAYWTNVLVVIYNILKMFLFLFILIK